MKYQGIYTDLESVINKLQNKTMVEDISKNLPTEPPNLHKKSIRKMVKIKIKKAK